jgi:hypothetical protein
MRKHGNERAHANIGSRRGRCRRIRWADGGGAITPPAPRILRRVGKHGAQSREPIPPHRLSGRDRATIVKRGNVTGRIPCGSRNGPSLNPMELSLARIRENEVVEANLAGHFACGREEMEEQLTEVVGAHAVEVVLPFAARLDKP